MCLLLLLFPVPFAIAIAPALSLCKDGVSAVGSMNLRIECRNTNCFAAMVAAFSSASLTDVETVVCLFADAVIGIPVVNGASLSLA